MLCEMCGKEVATPTMVRVEGTVLALCDDCSRFGTAVTPAAGAVARGPRGTGGEGTEAAVDERLRVQSRRREERDLYAELPEVDLLPDWPKRIRQAREKLGWTPEDLGKKLNEKKSLVLKLESGAFRPPDATLRKVEHLLKIRLRANPGELG